MREIDIECADHWTGERNVVLEPRTAGQVEHHPRQRLVERNVGMAVARESRLVAERLLDRLTECDADIFDGMVRIDVQIAFRLDREVEHAVARDLVEHMIEERHAGRKLGAASAVEIHRDNDRRFPGHALDAGAAPG